MFAIVDEGPDDGPAIEHLLDLTFGPDRHGKTSYRYRQSVAQRDDLARVARCETALVGTIRYWPVRVDATPALLLGPLGVDPMRRGLGIGRALIRTTLAHIRAGGGAPVLLVGDAAYYAPLGFVAAAPGIVMPGEAPHRLMALAVGVPLPTGTLYSLAAPSEPRPLASTSADTSV